jgi:hypothetical protein
LKTSSFYKLEQDQALKNNKGSIHEDKHDSSTNYHPNLLHLSLEVRFTLTRYSQLKAFSPYFHPTFEIPYKNTRNFIFQSKTTIHSQSSLPAIVECYHYQHKIPLLSRNLLS